MDMRLSCPRIQPIVCPGFGKLQRWFRSPDAAFRAGYLMGILTAGAPPGERHTAGDFGLLLQIKGGNGFFFQGQFFTECQFLFHNSDSLRMRISLFFRKKSGASTPTGGIYNAVIRTSGFVGVHAANAEHRSGHTAGDFGLLLRI